MIFFSASRGAVAPSKATANRHTRRDSLQASQAPNRDHQPVLAPSGIGGVLGHPESPAGESARRAQPCRTPANSIFPLWIGRGDGRSFQRTPGRLSASPSIRVASNCPFQSTKRYDGAEQIFSSSAASNKFQTGTTAQAARCSCMLTYGWKNLVLPALVTQSFALDSVWRVGKVFPSVAACGLKSTYEWSFRHV
jgi:hypothetical protein